jgi:hypothetical protein
VLAHQHSATMGGARVALTAVQLVLDHPLLITSTRACLRGYASLTMGEAYLMSARALLDDEEHAGVGCGCDTSTTCLRKYLDRVCGPR